MSVFRKLLDKVVGDGTQVVSRLRTATPQQVMLKVTIAEVSRSLTRGVGANLQGGNGNGFSFAQGRDFIDDTDPLNPITTFLSPGTTAVGRVLDVLGVNVTGALDLNEANGLVTILAEPTLTALSGETASFQVAAPGPYDLVLSETRLSNPGDTVAGLGKDGPAGVAVLEGQVSLGGQTLTAEGTALQQPGDAGTFTNTGTGPARLLTLQVRSAGAAPGLPNTGAGGRQTDAAVLATAGLAGLGTAALVACGWLALRRRPGRR